MTAQHKYSSRRVETTAQSRGGNFGMVMDVMRCGSCRSGRRRHDGRRILFRRRAPSTGVRSDAAIADRAAARRRRSDHRAGPGLHRSRRGHRPGEYRRAGGQGHPERRGRPLAGPIVRRVHDRGRLAERCRAGRAGAAALLDRRPSSRASSGFRPRLSPTAGCDCAAKRGWRCRPGRPPPLSPTCGAPPAAPPTATPTSSPPRGASCWSTRWPV